MSRNKQSKTITEQASYCGTMANKLVARVLLRESARNPLGYISPSQITPEASKENIDRMITQLRLELLELRDMVDGARQ